MPTLFSSDDPDPGPALLESTQGLSQLRRPATIDADEPSRFIPGTVLLDRYRVVALVGRGAMGELYRAEDLKLREPVALKFLPESVAHDGAMLARLYREVRIAHQISHPNVCRVFDIGVADGQHFISMEYIDGENLASLLRRIGHPPQHKALQMAQQLCMGLAAAHGRGVLHRDIKPANVMIDGRGQVKITDFGLAGLVEELHGRETRAGTPAYMAPEQLHGLAVSVQSDVYALGLVLFELFTGHRAFPNHQRGIPPRPSSFVEGINPAIERTLYQCLKTDPAERPAAVTDVAALLPGGDPLAAALAAGELPSPEMVAAAPQKGTLRPAVALACMGLLVFEILVLALFSPQAMLYSRLPLEKSPEVLAQRAEDILVGMGFELPVGRAFGFRHDHTVPRHLARIDDSAERWSSLETGRASVLFFWYRTSPRPIPSMAAGYWRAGLDDPPMTLPGMNLVVLDTRGRLTAFRTVLPNEESPGPWSQEATGHAPVTNWEPLFKAAGLRRDEFLPIRPQWIPPVHNDERKAWSGAFPDLPDFEDIRVEAASFRGRPVFFQVVAPWTTPLSAWSRPVPAEIHEEPGRSPAGSVAFQILLVAVIATVLVSAGFLAWRHLTGGRGDRQGALRLAWTLFFISMISWIFWASHVPTLAELTLFIQATAMALFRSAFLWMVYLALEPFVRQSWPERIISWSRLLGGRWRDPLVGRDLLIGALLGLGLLLVQILGGWAPAWYGEPIDPVDFASMDTDPLNGLPGVLRQMHEHLFFGSLMGLGCLFLHLLFTIVVGRERLATAAFWLLLTTGLNLAFTGAAPTKVALAAGAAAMVFVLQRFGLLAIIAAMVFYMTFRFFPISVNPAVWYMEATILAILVVAVPALYGGYLALAGQPLLRPNLLEDRVSSISNP